MNQKPCRQELSFDEYKEKELTELSLKEGVFEYKDRGIRYKYYYYQSNVFYRRKKIMRTHIADPSHSISVRRTLFLNLIHALSVSLSVSRTHVDVRVWCPMRVYGCMMHIHVCERW